MLMPPYACTIPKIRYKEEIGQGTAVSETPEMERVKRNQEAISTVHCGVTPHLPCFLLECPQNAS